MDDMSVRLGRALPELFVDIEGYGADEYWGSSKIQYSRAPHCL